MDQCLRCEDGSPSASATLTCELSKLEDGTVKSREGPYTVAARSKGYSFTNAPCSRVSIGVGVPLELRIELNLQILSKIEV